MIVKLSKLLAAGFVRCVAAKPCGSAGLALTLGLCLIREYLPTIIYFEAARGLA